MTIRQYPPPETVTVLTATVPDWAVLPSMWKLQFTFVFGNVTGLELELAATVTGEGQPCVSKLMVCAAVPAFVNVTWPSSCTQALFAPFGKPVSLIVSVAVGPGVQLAPPPPPPPPPHAASASAPNVTQATA